MDAIVILQKSPLFAFLFIDLLFIHLFLPSKVFIMQNLKKNNQEQIQPIFFGLFHNLWLCLIKVIHVFLIYLFIIIIIIILLLLLLSSSSFNLLIYLL